MVPPPQCPSWAGEKTHSAFQRLLLQADLAHKSKRSADSMIQRLLLPASHAHESERRFGRSLPKGADSTPTRLDKRNARWIAHGAIHNGEWRDPAGREGVKALAVACSTTPSNAIVRFGELTPREQAAVLTNLSEWRHARWWSTVGFAQWWSTDGLPSTTTTLRQLSVPAEVVNRVIAFVL